MPSDLRCSHTVGSTRERHRSDQGLRNAELPRIHVPSGQWRLRLFARKLHVVYSGELLEAADRIRAVQRAFNCRLGLRREDDTPSEVNFETSLKGAFYDQEIDMKMDREKFEWALTEFYKLVGYDEKTGIPIRETLEKLGLEDVAEDLTKRGVLSK